MKDRNFKVVLPEDGTIHVVFESKTGPEALTEWEYVKLMYRLQKALAETSKQMADYLEHKQIIQDEIAVLCGEGAIKEVGEDG